jgi:hypothetical protein
MKTISADELKIILQSHKNWLEAKPNGKRADLSEADLCGANLRRANLSEANLSEANLSEANLSEANLSEANLSEANLSGVINFPEMSILPDEGDVIGWKKCQNGVIVKLLIPAQAKRSNATGRKCRAEYVKVLEVIGSNKGVSSYDYTTTYTIGAEVRCDQWCEDRWQECAGGIHFFITRREAENYQV